MAGVQRREIRGVQQARNNVKGQKSCLRRRQQQTRVNIAARWAWKPKKFVAYWKVEKGVDWADVHDETSKPPLLYL